MLFFLDLLWGCKVRKSWAPWRLSCHCGCRIRGCNAREKQDAVWHSAQSAQVLQRCQVSVNFTEVNKTWVCILWNRGNALKRLNSRLDVWRGCGAACSKWRNVLQCRVVCSACELFVLPVKTLKTELLSIFSFFLEPLDRILLYLYEYWYILSSPSTELADPNSMMMDIIRMKWMMAFTTQTSTRESSLK